MSKQTFITLSGITTFVLLTVTSLWIAASTNGNASVVDVKTPATEALKVTLSSDNLITLKGEVTQDSVDKTLKAFYSKFDVKTPIYFFIDTPGGEVESGLILAQFLKATSQNVICIAKQAQSMGFLLLQSCKIRGVTDATILMAHELGTGLPQYSILPDLRRLLNELENVQDYLNSIMAERIGITTKELQAKMTPMWITHGGKLSVKLNLADRIYLPICTKELFESKVDGPVETIAASMAGTLAGPADKISGCPL